MSTIRPADEVDLPALFGLDHMAGQDGERREEIRRAVAAQQCHLVDEDGRILGYVIFDHGFFGQGFVHTLYVAEAARGQGTATALMRHAETLCVTPKLFTSTNLSNHPMQSLLGRLGYRLSGVIHDLDEGDPELIYVKYLPHHCAGGPFVVNFTCRHSHGACVRATGGGAMGETDTHPESGALYRSVMMTVLMTPDMANFSGHVHGGAILRLMDQVAYACAARYSGSYVVTVSVDQVTFRQPVYVGEMLTFHASINYTGNTSMEVGIRAEAEDIRQRTSRHVLTCYLTMVAVDEEGRPARVPTVPVNTPAEQRRWAAAQLRRAFRKEIEERSLEIRQHPEELLEREG